MGGSYVSEGLTKMAGLNDMNKLLTASLRKRVGQIVSQSGGFLKLT